MTEERTAAFKTHIDAGQKIEAADWVPDAYPEGALRSACR